MTTALQNLSSSWKVDSATSLSNSLASNTVGKSGTGDKSLGQSDYLKLMTAQLQFQDPFAPMDNSQMVAQMAQFSQIAASTESNTTLKTIADSLSGSRLSDAASWIGKSMLVKSEKVAPDTLGQYAGQITLSGDSDALKVELVDSAGSVVKSIDMGKQKAGDVNFYWNGEDDAGERAASGPLTIRVTGGTTSKIASWATVAAVQSPASGGDAKLITPLGNFTPADALSLG
ncbi:flagellar hook capping protein [Sphingobium sufflavum]|uniref:flagellar hook assembly protein FlgD n=1 Tax=Sphingobium sufflavum TaxID=1129547 RepID=UPI001F3931EA|nr:flagellar hook capping FlgD N-terminal domain-containing protein [Sphingobium sufflavum]MCE7797346.1 flagellar hook capping protein [Sphingobium sufflavum]